MPGTVLKIVDPDTLQELPDGHQGLILAKGPGVMRGYLNDSVSTDSAMRAGGGFFDTGDLGWKAPGLLFISLSAWPNNPPPPPSLL